MQRQLSYAPHLPFAANLALESDLRAMPACCPPPTSWPAWLWCCCSLWALTPGSLGTSCQRPRDSQRRHRAKPEPLPADCARIPPSRLKCWVCPVWTLSGRPESSPFRAAKSMDVGFATCYLPHLSHPRYPGGATLWPCHLPGWVLILPVAVPSTQTRSTPSELLPLTPFIAIDSSVPGLGAWSLESMWGCQRPPASPQSSQLPSH